jgi:hypothetical protein
LEGGAARASVQSVAVLSGESAGRAAASCVSVRGRCRRRRGEARCGQARALAGGGSRQMLAPPARCCDGTCDVHVRLFAVQLRYRVPCLRRSQRRRWAPEGRSLLLGGGLQYSGGTAAGTFRLLVAVRLLCRYAPRLCPSPSHAKPGMHSPGASLGSRRYDGARAAVRCCPPPSSWVWPSSWLPSAGGRKEGQQSCSAASLAAQPPRPAPAQPCSPPNPAPQLPLTVFLTLGAAACRQGWRACITRSPRQYVGRPDAESRAAGSPRAVATVDAAHPAPARLLRLGGGRLLLWSGLGLLGCGLQAGGRRTTSEMPEQSGETRHSHPRRALGGGGRERGWGQGRGWRLLVKQDPRRTNTHRTHLCCLLLSLGLGGGLGLGGLGLLLQQRGGRARGRGRGWAGGGSAGRGVPASAATHQPRLPRIKLRQRQRSEQSTGKAAGRGRGESCRERGQRYKQVEERTGGPPPHLGCRLLGRGLLLGRLLLELIALLGIKKGIKGKQRGSLGRGQAGQACRGR